MSNVTLKPSVARMSHYYGDSLTIVWILKYTITGRSFGSLRKQAAFPDANTNFFAK